MRAVEQSGGNRVVREMGLAQFLVIGGFEEIVST